VAWAALGLAMILCLWPVGAGAQTGSLEFKYQRLELQGRVFHPDGSASDTTFVRSFWTQNYLASVTRRFGNRLFLAVQGQYDRQSFIDRNERSETPYGQFRLAHPVVGLIASYRPTIATRQVAAIGSGGGVVDTGAVRTVGFRSEQSVVSAYVSPARLPRVDLSWIRLHHAPDALSAENTQDTRNARMGWTRGPLNLRAGYGDVSQGIRPSSLGAPVQRYYDAGLGLGVVPRPNAGLRLDYDARRFVRGPSGTIQNRVLTQAASLSGSYQQTPKLGWNVSYNLQHTEQEYLLSSRFTDQEAQLLGSWRPTPVLGLQGSAGARTLRSGRGSELQRFVSSTASMRGRVRPDWDADATVSQSLTWNPRESVVATTQARTSSKWRLRRGLEAGGDYQVSVDRNASASRRVVSQWSLSLTASPWRSFRARLGEHRYQIRSGDSLAAGSSRSRTVEVRWTPFRTLEMLGNVSTSGVPPRNDPRTTSTTASVQWSPGAGIQVSGNYARTSSAQSNALVSLVPGRELAGARVAWGPGRRWAVSGGLTVVEPNRSTEARQYDASYTYRFGR